MAMTAKLVESGEVIFPLWSRLNETTARSMGVYLGYLIDQGAKRIILDFSRVDDFQYFGMAVFMDIVLGLKRAGRVEIGLQGLDGECLTAANCLGLQKVAER